MPSEAPTIPQCAVCRRAAGAALQSNVVSAGGPDLFVVCKSCGSEVSPYITECPYCGNRLRKRAPKIDRDGRVAEKRRRRPPMPSLPRLRSGEIPGIRADTRPYATIALLVLAGFAGCILWRTTARSTSTRSRSSASRAATGGGCSRRAFTYDNTGYAFAALAAIALFGWLLERRHGPLVVLALFVIGGVGGHGRDGRGRLIPGRRSAATARRWRCRGLGDPGPARLLTGRTRDRRRPDRRRGVRGGRRADAARRQGGELGRGRGRRAGGCASLGLAARARPVRR